MPVYITLVNVPAAAAATAATLRERLMGVAGLSAADGLHAVGGDVDLYARLLSMLLDSDLPARLSSELQAGHAAAGQQAAHTFKGVAATLGANALRDQAAEIDHQLRALSEGAVPAALCEQAERMLKDFEALTAAIRAALQS